MRTFNHRIFLLAAAFLLQYSPLTGQTGSATTPADKILYAEALGIGGFFSLNYERVVFRALKDHLMGSYSVGASSLITNRPGDAERRFFLLQRANLCAGHKGWYLEAGLDLILDRGINTNSVTGEWTRWNSNFSLFYHLGLRYQKPSGGLFAKAYVFRINDYGSNEYFTKNIGKPSDPVGKDQVFWWGGLGVGYAF